MLVSRLIHVDGPHTIRTVQRIVEVYGAPLEIRMDPRSVKGEMPEMVLGVRVRLCETPCLAAIVLVESQ